MGGKSIFLVFNFSVGSVDPFLHFVDSRIIATDKVECEIHQLEAVRMGTQSQTISLLQHAGLHQVLISISLLLY